MTLRLSSFRSFFSIVLVLMVAIPCALKAELKQNLGIEYTPKAGSNKQVCATFTLNTQQHSQNRTTGTHPFSSAESAVTGKCSGPDKLAEFFSAQKEKIPTFLLFCNFRI